MAARAAPPSVVDTGGRTAGRLEEDPMRGMYLYFAETDDPSRDRSRASGGSRPGGDGPLVPIQPGAFSRWMANRNRVVAENAAALRGAVDGSPFRRLQNPEATG
jgi:hypothetical protein